MYFPYFYGRGAELLALRDVARSLAAWGNVIPIIEPVKSKPRDLSRCLEQLQPTGARVYLIVNPSHGDFQEADAGPEWRRAASRFIDDHDFIFPTYQISTFGDAAAIGQFFGEFSDRRVGVVVRSADLAADTLRGLISDRDATVFIHQSANPRAFVRVLPVEKAVEVVSAFNVQARNADYAGSEWFTSGNQEFAEDGRPGFSDFGPLPNTFSESGGPPGAVAIHLTYQATDGSIWVQHFISDSTDRSQGDVASKMAEATAKVIDEAVGNPMKFVNSVGLQAFQSQHTNESPTHLASNKRQQLTHHLTTIAEAL